MTTPVGSEPVSVDRPATKKSTGQSAYGTTDKSTCETTGHSSDGVSKQVADDAVKLGFWLRSTSLRLSGRGEGEHGAQGCDDAGGLHFA